MKIHSLEGFREELEIALNYCDTDQVSGEKIVQRRYRLNEVEYDFLVKAHEKYPVWNKRIISKLAKSLNFDFDRVQKWYNKRNSKLREASRHTFCSQN